MLITVTVLFSIVFLSVCRIVFVVIRTLNKSKTKTKRSPQDKINTVIVIGSGGHTSEMMYLVECLDLSRYSPRLYLMASSDVSSEQKIHDFESKTKAKGIQGKYEVFKIPRSRQVHQSYLTSIFTTVYSVLASIPIMLRFNPELVLCNGPGTCVPICVIAFIMKCSFISTNTIIFVESVCRVQSLSLSGKILQWIADEIMVQWSELVLKCRRAKYIGRVA